MNILDILIWGGVVAAIGILIGWGIYSMQAGREP